MKDLQIRVSRLKEIIAALRGPRQVRATILENFKEARYLLSACDIPRDSAVVQEALKYLRSPVAYDQFRAALVRTKGPLALSRGRFQKDDLGPHFRKWSPKQLAKRKAKRGRKMVTEYQKYVGSAPKVMGSMRPRLLYSHFESKRRKH